MIQEWTCLGDDVARAAGVVVAQIGCRPFEALQILRAACDASGRPMDEIAVAVIERRVRFDHYPAVPGSMLRRRVSAQCLEIGAGDAALNCASDRGDR
jgi:hypothetical protein